LYTELIPDNVWRQMSEHCFKLEAEMKKRFGADAMFLSETGLVTNVNNADGSQTKLVGIADLLVIDSHGNINVFDYKTSPKSFGEYDRAKKLTFRYQLATYRRMLQRLGFNLNEHSGVYIIPFKFENFKYDQGTDTSTFDNL
jgi:RecB family exonuclease